MTKHEMIGGSAAAVAFGWLSVVACDSPVHRSAGEAAAVRTFAALTDEARRWKGQPTRFADAGQRRIAAWPDLEIRQSGRGIMVRTRAPRFDSWWHERERWEGDPMRPIYDWLEQERGGR